MTEIAADAAPAKVRSTAERWVEKTLWNSRLLTWLAVLASMIAAISVFLITSVDTVYIGKDTLAYVNFSLPDEEREAAQAKILTRVISLVDGYLMATFLLIFAMGLYELFISKLEEAEGQANNVLTIHSLDDLKTRLGRVILMMLIVKFFEHAVRGSIEIKTPTELITFSGSVLLVSIALYVSHLGHGGGDKGH